MTNENNFLENMLSGYLDCAEWADAPEDSNPEGFTERFTAQAAKDCALFFEANKALLLTLYGDKPERSGHDLWLTRNHHGVGFWDRGNGVDGQTLTDAAHNMSEVDLYVNDDNFLDA